MRAPKSQFWGHLEGPHFLCGITRKVRGSLRATPLTIGGVHICYSTGPPPRPGWPSQMVAGGSVPAAEDPSRAGFPGAQAGFLGGSWAG